MTWTRKELKEKALAAFKTNIFACIVVALVLTIALSNNSSSNDDNNSNTDNSSSYYYDINSFSELTNIDSSFDQITGSGLTGTIGDLGGSYTGVGKYTGIVKAIATLFGGGMMLVVILLAVVFSIALNFFVINPIEVGCRRFFLLNTEGPASMREIFYGFTCGSYMNIVKVMFVRDLYILGWSLLLIIPGIVKSYEYMMIPYLLCEDPNMDKDTAFAATKQLMDGEKMNTFVLQLSFILWHLLSSIFWGIPGILFVNPYVYQTEAFLYLTLTNRFQNGSQNYNADYYPGY